MAQLRCDILETVYDRPNHSVLIDFVVTHPQATAHLNSNTIEKHGTPAKEAEVEKDNKYGRLHNLP